MLKSKMLVNTVCFVLTLKFIGTSVQFRNACVQGDENRS